MKLVIGSIIFLIVAHIGTSMTFGRYLSLPESMAEQCFNTINHRYDVRIQDISEIPVDSAVLRQMIEFEEDQRTKELKRVCGFTDKSDLPEPSTIAEVKP